VIASVFTAALVVPTSAQNPQQAPPAAQQQAPAGRQGGRGVMTPERKAQMIAAQSEEQKRTDDVWRRASEGYMKMEKVTYKSKVDGFPIPAFVFTPLQPRGSKGHPALVWVHPDIRGHLYEYYFPYVREAVKRGYVVIAPEYRGSYGYGAEHYDAIDYGGAEVDDVATAVDYLKTNVPIVDTDRVGIIGWSHGGSISLLTTLRNPKLFKATVAIVPVTNLFQRLAYSGVESYLGAIDPGGRIGGTPAQKRDVYVYRSPIYQIDKLENPILVHITRNDGDVHIEEAQQLVDALRNRKPFLAETKIYEAPLGAHLFDRMCPATLPGAARGGGARVDMTDLKSYEPTNTPEQRASWNRVWTFLEWNLRPYQGAK
jgi:dipeptidyl aminopeptidase/acylaminoacyl peptidase